MSKYLGGVMMQYFHWYNAVDVDGKSLWVQLSEQAASLKSAGIDALWLPPSYKGSGGSNDVGYSTYDLFDLGEFDQKGSVRTKYGTKDELLAALKACKDVGLQIYLDAVFNHKFGGDEVEKVMAHPVAWEDRNRITGDLVEIGAYTKFFFPGRNGKYSDMVWTYEHFDAVDYDDIKKESKIFLLEGKEFDDDLDLENGNYDYLMGSDLDMDSPAVREELKKWGRWVMDLTECAGFRLDAVKHISRDFFDYWITDMDKYSQEKFGRPIYIVGEYLSEHLSALDWYANCCDGKMQLFDFPLHFNFYKAATDDNFDMRAIFDGTFVKDRQNQAVTFVDNHDTQELQAFGSSAIPANFKTIAYTIILLRPSGYPCVFYADYFGAEYEDKGQQVKMYEQKGFIDNLLFNRKNHMRGECYDYFNQQHILGWVFRGETPEDKAMAVVVSNGPPGAERMEVSRPGAVFKDSTRSVEYDVTVGEDGWADFPVEGRSVSVWVQQ